MTLLIAYLLLAHTGAEWWAYVLTFILWFMHVWMNYIAGKG
jgi:hypothetical protein